MPLEAVALDERALERGSSAQRAEWETSTRELIDKAVCNLEEPSKLTVTVTEQDFVLTFESLDGAPLGEATIGYDQLSDHVTEYLDIVRQITSADSLNQMEALDMAKKVTHDRAGRVLKRALREFGLDLETSRRLFTLLLSLKVDTTRLAPFRGHRRAR